MTIQRMDHVGIVVDDLAAATEFFVELGLVLQGEGSVEGGWVDRVVGLEGVRADIAMMQTPDGNGRLELTKFHSPSNQGDGERPGYPTRRIRRRGHRRRRCRSTTTALNSSESWSATRTATGSATSAAPKGIIVELAEQIG
jgi:Glyoxalase/Bleomycin resistance protein/Dioxygenase superfamily